MTTTVDYAVSGIVGKLTIGFSVYVAVSAIAMGIVVQFYTNPLSLAFTAGGVGMLGGLLGIIVANYIYPNIRIL